MSAPQAQPKSILRGHKAQVHVLAFIRGHERLASGDAEGFVVLWDLATMRPTAAWRPHENAILGIQSWGADRIITHGRDHKLAVWKLGVGDESTLSKRLPLDDAPEQRPQPWLLHLLEVNTMNFCSFASCVPAFPASPDVQDQPGLLIAVPNTIASEAVDIFELPSQKRQQTIKSNDKNGMVMALSLFYRAGVLTVAASFENGLTTVSQQDENKTWTVVYRAQAHSQPILSLDVDLEQGYCITSGVDATIAKHPLPLHSGEEGVESIQRLQTQPIKVLNTKHSGQQSLKIRDDGRIFATAGWDSMIRVYSCKTMKEVATLKWHRVGCYAIAFAPADVRNMPPVDGVQDSRTASNNLSRATDASGEPSVKDRRIHQAKTAHWLAAGGKDGKISLWDIF